MIYTAKDLIERANWQREGFAEAVIKESKELGEDRFEVEDAIALRLVREFERNTTVGLGDAVAIFATPVARALGLGCVDPATGRLRPESGCAKRKAAWNSAVPDLRHPLRRVDKETK